MALRFADACDVPHFEAGCAARTVDSEIDIQADDAEEGGCTCGKDFANSFDVCRGREPAKWSRGADTPVGHRYREDGQKGPQC